MLGVAKGVSKTVLAANVVNQTLLFCTDVAMVNCIGAKQSGIQHNLAIFARVQPTDLGRPLRVAMNMAALIQMGWLFLCIATRVVVI